MIDCNGDGEWDYTFDELSGLLMPYQKVEEETPGFELILVVCSSALVIFWKRKRK